jgi:hypothetical protein
MLEAPIAVAASRTKSAPTSTISAGETIRVLAVSLSHYHLTAAKLSGWIKDAHWRLLVRHPFPCQPRQVICRGNEATLRSRRSANWASSRHATLVVMRTHIDKLPKLMRALHAHLEYFPPESASDSERTWSGPFLSTSEGDVCSSRVVLYKDTLFLQLMPPNRIAVLEWVIGSDAAAPRRFCDTNANLSACSPSCRSQ